MLNPYQQLPIQKVKYHCLKIELTYLFLEIISASNSTLNNLDIIKQYIKIINKIISENPIILKQQNKTLQKKALRFLKLYGFDNEFKEVFKLKLRVHVLKKINLGMFRFL